MNVSGRHAVVTGGGRGIGLAIANALAQNGATVSVMSRSIGSATLPYFRAQVDVTDAGSIAEAFAKARTQNGPITILINNSGIAKSAPLKRTTREMWDEIIATNLTGTFLCTQLALSDMIEAKFGRIVNVASIAGLYGAPYLAAYTASKHGVVGLTRALAEELHGEGITVNAVCPGYTETDMMAQAIRNIMQKTGLSEGSARAELAKVNPEGRIVTPQEVAAAVLDYCNSLMNGQCMILPGGVVA